MTHLSAEEVAHRLAVANAYAAELEQRVVILNKRLEHADIETAQARVSRDSYKSKILTLMGALKDHGITLEVDGRELGYWTLAASAQSATPLDKPNPAR